MWGNKTDEFVRVQGPDIGAGEEQMYQLKTMCLAKKTVQMPSKEEHGFLLFCGLGKLTLPYI